MDIYLFIYVSAANLFDIFQVQGYLQPGVPVRVTLNRSDPRFYLLLGPTAIDKEYFFDITDINLRIPVVAITDSLKPMMLGLCEKQPARYYFNSLITKSYNIPSDASMHEIPRVFTEKIPQR